jgi:cytochrome c peroxidase
LGSELIVPIQAPQLTNKEKILLGKKLFFEPLLSQDNTVSCATCHNLDQGGDDNLQFSVGVNQKIGKINSPTVFNVKYNFVQFWDGRAKDLKEQVAVPIHDPLEMNSNFEQIIEKLNGHKTYVHAFKTVYNDTIKQEHIIDAIVAFENVLVTPNARFDQFLKGNKAALTQTEKKGFVLFKEYGCIACHNGVNLGGNLFQKVGIFKSFSYKNDNYLGRYNVTKDENDKYFYKVPTLRNIELTAPYLHSGELKTLPEAIEFMLKYQVGIKPSQKEVHAIHAFLKTLTGEKPAVLDME